MVVLFYVSIHIELLSQEGLPGIRGTVLSAPSLTEGSVSGQVAHLNMVFVFRICNYFPSEACSLALSRGLVKASLMKQSIEILHF